MTSSKANKTVHKKESALHQASIYTCWLLYYRLLSPVDLITRAVIRSASHVAPVQWKYVCGYRSQVWLLFTPTITMQEKCDLSDLAW